MALWLAVIAGNNLQNESRYMQRPYCRSYSLRQLFVFATLTVIAVAMIAELCFRRNSGVRVEAGSPWGTNHVRLKTHQLVGFKGRDAGEMKIVKSTITRLQGKKPIMTSTPLGGDLRQVYSSDIFEVHKEVCHSWNINDSRSRYFEIDITAAGVSSPDNWQLLIATSSKKYSFTPAAQCWPAEAITFTPPFKTDEGWLVYRLMADVDNPKIEVIVYDIYLFAP